ncbi:hypothetical protein Mal64_28570 [Pseudobythopirellula maris]|uniref:Uncharacterized protein n=1 Tax=Pseudobythopirellula maris TaxID=2527991 RepID=A0A5C5ZIZ4_9BACT|nr:hypothetical protein [Pseudobythopirellula maris]TWT87319.1 hypothetical protein Mal64_28570 [Pseudobythopirellula maris]
MSDADLKPAESSPKRIRFRIWHLLLITAILAACFARLTDFIPFRVEREGLVIIVDEPTYLASVGHLPVEKQPDESVFRHVAFSNKLETCELRITPPEVIDSVLALDQPKSIMAARQPVDFRWPSGGLKIAYRWAKPSTESGAEYADVSSDSTGQSTGRAFGGNVSGWDQSRKTWGKLSLSLQFTMFHDMTEFVETGSTIVTDSHRFRGKLYYKGPSLDEDLVWVSPVHDGKRVLFVLRNANK